MSNQFICPDCSKPLSSRRRLRGHRERMHEEVYKDKLEEWKSKVEEAESR